MRFSPSPTTLIFYSNEHLKNDFELATSPLYGTVVEANAVQPPNTPSPMEVTDPGMIIEVSPQQQNVYLQIEVSDSEIVADSKPYQQQKPSFR